MRCRKRRPYHPESISCAPPRACLDREHVRHTTRFQDLLRRALTRFRAFECVSSRGARHRSPGSLCVRQTRCPKTDGDFSPCDGGAPSSDKCTSMSIFRLAYGSASRVEAIEEHLGL